MRDRARKVSCLALTFFYDYLHVRGIPRSVLQKGLDYPPSHLDDRLSWIDLATFAEIERRFAAVFPDDPDVFVRAGESLCKTGGFGFLRVIARLLASPEQVYAALPLFVGKFLFPFVSIIVEDPGQSRILLFYRFEPSYAPTDAFLDTVRGVLTAIPCLFNAPPARVGMTRESLHRVCFDVDLPAEPSHKGLFRRARERATLLRVRWQTGAEAARELLEANRLLHEQVDALTAAQGDLKRTVRDLRVLNALARESARELETGLHARKAAALLSDRLGRMPTAVLRAEGTPPRLSVAASGHVDSAALVELDALAGTDHPAARALLDSERATAREARLGSTTWILVPLRSRDRVLGALAFPSSILREHDPAFLESLASQLAVAMDNATSYRLVAELRDTLELRVRERTADLEASRVTLEATVDRLDRADRARHDFFMNVSHELKTPLALILGPLDEVEAALDPARQPGAAASLETARRNALLLRRLFNDVLDFARFDSGSVPVSLEPVDVGHLAGEVAIMLSPIAEAQHVALRCERPDLPIIATTDAKLTHRILVNLLANAIKYVDPGDSVTVRVETCGDEVVLEVEDDGPGIAKEELGRIFERFRRARDARGRVVEGSGIGLALVKEAVEVLGGVIAVESEVGRGSLFRVRLPISSELPGAARDRTPGLPNHVLDTSFDLGALLETPAPSAEDDRDATTGAPEGRVLLVEDNADMRGFLARVLARRFRVLVAANGVAALEIARREVPDVVLTDVMMPEMDGHELCRRLKAEPVTSNTKVILISARHGTGAALAAFEGGADDFVVKPFSTPELLARIGAQLRIRSLSQELAQSENHRTLGVLAAGIAHEVKNPVNGVINAVPPLRAVIAKLAYPGASPDEREMLEALLHVIEDSGARIQRTVDAVLALARPGSGRGTLQKVRLREGIEAVVRMLGPRQDGVTVHTTIEHTEPFLTDPQLVDQVLMNLLLNAHDALAETGGNIWIVVRAAGDMLEIRVRDDGPGIEPENVERIFAPFFTTKDPGKGTGLGLSISRQRVMRYGGTLELVSGGGRGAEFRVSLPFLPLEASSSEARHGKGTP